MAVASATICFAGSERNSKETAAVPPECDWSGFYVGAHVGVANFQAKFTDLDYFEGYDTRVFEDTAFLGGGQVGYNWQMNQLVLGLEADGSGSTADIHTRTGTYFDSPAHQDDIASIDFLGTVRARVGVSFQNALVYVTAGGAYAHGDWQERYFSSSTPSSADAFWKGEDWRWGWTAGVGIEYMFNCNWSLRAETLYTHLQDDTDNTADPANSIYRLARYQFDDELWSVRLGLNYKFGKFFGR